MTALPDEHDDSRHAALLDEAFGVYLRRVLLEDPPELERFLSDWPVEIRAELAQRIRDLSAMRQGLALEDSLETGFELGPYRLIREIGRGGTGTVWSAEEVGLGREVALKFLHGGASLSPGARASLEREARAACHLNHAGVVTLFEVEEWEGVPYLVLELVDPPRTLADELAARALRQDALGSEHDAWAARYFLACAQAMRYAHQRELIHGDLKPHNLLVTPEGEPKITDLGVASIDGDSAPREEHHTQGTLPYLAPEQLAADDRRPSVQSDVFALGACLFEALTFRRLRDADGKTQVREQARAGAVPDPRSLRPRAPRDLARVCMRALASDPEKRYGSMEELALDLQRFLRLEPVIPEEASVARRGWLWSRRHPGRATGLVLGLLLLIVGGALLVQLTFSQERTERAYAIIPMLMSLYDPSAPLDEAGREALLAEVEQAAGGLGDPERDLRTALYLGIGQICLSQGQAELARAALVRAERSGVSENSRWTWAEAWVALRLASALRSLDRPDEARERLFAALDALPPDAEELLRTRLAAECAWAAVRDPDLESMAEFERRFGDPHEHLKWAEDWAEGVYGRDSLEWLEARAAVALWHDRSGDPREASDISSSVANVADTSLPRLHVFAIQAHLDYARVLARLDRHRQAATHLSAAHLRRCEVNGVGHPRALELELELAMTYLRGRNYEGAEAQFASAAERAEAAGIERLRARARRGLHRVKARRLIQRMSPESAAQVIEELAPLAEEMQAACAELRALGGEERELWRESMLDLIPVMLALGDHEGALACIDEVELDGHALDAGQRVHLARLRAQVLRNEQGDPAELAARERAFELAESCDATHPELALTAGFELERACARHGRRERALEVRRDSAALLEPMEPSDLGAAAWTGLLEATAEADDEARRAALRKIAQRDPGGDPALDRLECAARWLATVELMECAKTAADRDESRQLLLRVAQHLRVEDRGSALHCDALLQRAR